MLCCRGVESVPGYEQAPPCKIWLISNRLPSDFKPNLLFKDADGDRVIEYRISDLAKYLLNPKSFEVMNRLVGCKICFKDSSFSKIENKINTFLKSVFKIDLADRKADPQTETLISDQPDPLPEMTEPALQFHVEQIQALLTPYDPIRARISELDLTKVIAVAGVCDDPEGRRTLLDIKGSIAQKIDYVLTHIQKEIAVTVKKAHLDKGLFEMRGFDLKSFDPENASRLVIVTQNSRYEAYVLTPGGEVAFHVEDAVLVKYLHFFQASLKTNAQLRALLHQCMMGHIQPLKLFFTKELAINYFKTDLPKLYKEVFETNLIPLDAKNTIVQALNQKQRGIALKYLPDAEQGRPRPITSIFVMHDVEALAAVKTALPQVYTQLNKKIGVLENEKYYLMDSMEV